MSFESVFTTDVVQYPKQKTSIDPTVRSVDHMARKFILADASGAEVLYYKQLQQRKQMEMKYQNDCKAVLNATCSKLGKETIADSAAETIGNAKKELYKALGIHENSE